MNALRTFFATSPALVVGSVSAVLAVLAAFQLPVTSEQSQAIVAAVGAIWSLLAALVIHTQTSSSAQVDNLVRTLQAGPTAQEPAQPAANGQGA